MLLDEVAKEEARYYANICYTSTEYARPYIKLASLATLRRCLKTTLRRAHSKTLRRMIKARIRRLERAQTSQ